MEDFVKIESGYPCSSYIIRQIKNDSDVWLYAKVLLSSLLQRDTSPSQALNILSGSLINLSIDTGISAPDFMSLSDTPEEICKLIINNSNVPDSKGCVVLYRKCDARTNACKICKYSKSFRNYNEDTEYSVLKYMLVDDEHLSKVLQYVDSSFFNACMDVSIGIPTAKAFVLPMTRILFDALSDESLRPLIFTRLDMSFFNDDEDVSPYDIVWKHAYNKFPKANKVPSNLLNNPMWGTSLKKVIKERIDASATLDTNEVVTVFEEYLQKVDSKDKVPQLDLFNLIKTIGKEPSISNEATSETIKDTDNVVSTSVDAMTSDAASYSFDNVATDISDTITPVSENSLLPTGDAGNNLFEDNVSDETSVDKEMSGESGEDTSLLDSGTVELDEANFNLVDKDFNISHSQYELELKNDIIVYATIPNDFVKSDMCVFLNGKSEVPAAFYHGTLRDCQLPVEVVTDFDGNFCYLYWSRHLHKFLLSKCQDTPLVLKQLLTRNKVEKLCHTPYLLYGVSKLYNIPVKNAFSIQTANNYAIPNTESLPYMNLLTSYETSRQYGSDVDSKYYDVCPFLGGMPLYRSLTKLLKELINQNPNFMTYYRKTLLDMAIGYSFLYKLNFKDEGYIAILRKDHSILFPEQYEHIKQSNGRYISYFVRERIDASSVFRFVIEELADKGLFRTSNIQLLGIHKQVMNLYVASTLEDYICTMIDILIFEHGNLYTKNGWNIECSKYNY